MNYLDFNYILLQWYAKNKRELPWRETKAPYNVWLSEIILQQTRVNQGLNYYLNFIKKYPTVRHLAAATEEDILKLWQGLGYYSRARNLHFAAKQIVNDFNGEFPNISSELKKLKGIGEYTSAAIASICFNEPIAVIDGNVYRVLARIFGIGTPIDSTEGIKSFRKLANSYVSNEHPGDYNQAIMDFGAMQCTPANPNCNECPFNNICEALHTNRIKELPVKSKKIKKRNRYIYYIIPTDGNYTFVAKRTNSDVWKNLYEFPLIEQTKTISIEELTNTKEWKSLLQNTNYTITSVSDKIKHLLTHQTLEIVFIEISFTIVKKFAQHYNKIDKKDIFELPVSKVIENYLQNNW